MTTRSRVVRCQALFLVLLPCSAVLAIPALGQPAARPAWTYQGGLGLSLTAVDAGTAAMKAIPAAGFGVQLDAMPRFYDVFALRAEMGLTFLGPLCFNDDTDCNEALDPFVSTDERPGYLMFSGSLAAGMFTPPFYLGTDRDGFYLTLGAYAGREWVNAWRGARYCVNCLDEEISLRGGLYLEPAAELALFPGTGLSVSYKTYHTRSDLAGRFTIRLTARTS